MSILQFFRQVRTQPLELGNKGAPPPRRSVGHSEHGSPNGEIGDARSDRAMAGVERSYDFRTSRSLNNTPPFALSVFGDSMI